MIRYVTHESQVVQLATFTASNSHVALRYWRRILWISQQFWLLKTIYSSHDYFFYAAPKHVDRKLYNLSVIRDVHEWKEREMHAYLWFHDIEEKIKKIKIKMQFLTLSEFSLTEKTNYWSCAPFCRIKKHIRNLREWLTKLGNRMAAG